jgi:putative dimethyl sulfoxide reductase chaperone
MASEFSNEEKVKWLSLLVAEELTLGLFGKILFEYPEKEWFQTISQEGVFEDIPFAENQKDVKEGMKLLSAWNAMHKAGLSQQAFEAIREEYMYLFIGPAKVLAPLWESTYFSKERTIFQEETLQVREWYRRFGLESVRLYNEPDDHLGLELAFIAHLAGQARMALEAGDDEKYHHLIEAQKEFISNHTLKWAAGWVSLVLEHARNDFFKGVALVIRGVLAEIKDVLNIEA